MALGVSAGVSGDILAGRDMEVQWEDVFRGMFTLVWYGWWVES